MSGNAVTEFTSVQSQYEAQVTADLERNETEQVRLRAEIESLQGQLETLERDHALLLGVQRVFANGATAGAAPGTKVPRARRAERPVKAKGSAGSAGSGTKAPAKKREAPAKKSARSATKRAAKAPAAGGGAGAAGAAEKQPSLAQLVSTMLAAHGEPRSAAEVSAELAADHPLRNSNVNVVRNALELLVAKSEAHRGKQNNSVFYTHVSGAGATPSPAAPAPAAG